MKKAKSANLLELSSCLNNSLLKENYFSDPKYIEDFILESIAKEELYTYSKGGKVIAFMRVDPVGMFSKFPLLRCISVNPDYRNLGIGKTLLDYYENLCVGKSTKVFLCVSDFNSKARKLYIESGYTEVGKIKGLYKAGVTEFLLCKTLIRENHENASYN